MPNSQTAHLSLLWVIVKCLYYCGIALCSHGQLLPVKIKLSYGMGIIGPQRDIHPRSMAVVIRLSARSYADASASSSLPCHKASSNRLEMQ